MKYPKRILFLTFNFSPDQSAGSIRTKLLVEKLNELQNNLHITILCSKPRRYGKKFETKNLEKEDKSYQKKNIRIIRLWIPFLGQGPLASLISYLFYFIQALLKSLFINPDITIVTSAKLLTAFLGAISSNINGSKLFVDLRDTFVDNYFYFYRWNKRIILISFIVILENLVIRSAYSINIISEGFKKGYFGWDSILKRKSISLTNFTNGYANDANSIIKFNKIKSKKNNIFYRVIYAGNVGAGQDLLSLIKYLGSNSKILEKMIRNKIKFEVYGSGSQIKSIKSLIGNSKNHLLNEILSLKGLVPKKDLKEIYLQADCLLVNLSNYYSLSMVIPSKIFEYAATPLPIIYGADGFTHDFIKKIDGTIRFKKNCPKSFFNAIIKSRNISINISRRINFLDKYNSDKIYGGYANHIIDALKRL